MKRAATAAWVPVLVGALLVRMRMGAARRVGAVIWVVGTAVQLVAGLRFVARRVATLRGAIDERLDLVEPTSHEEQESWLAAAQDEEPLPPRAIGEESV